MRASKGPVSRPGSNFNGVSFICFLVDWFDSSDDHSIFSARWPFPQMGAQRVQLDQTSIAQLTRCVVSYRRILTLCQDQKLFHEQNIFPKGSPTCTCTTVEANSITSNHRSMFCSRAMVTWFTSYPRPLSPRSSLISNTTRLTSKHARSLLAVGLGIKRKSICSMTTRNSSWTFWNLFRANGRLRPSKWPGMSSPITRKAAKVK